MSSRWISISLRGFERRHSGKLPIDGSVDALDERRFAHAACPPEQRIVGREALRKAQRVRKKRVPGAIDPAQQRDIDPVDAGNRDERGAPGGEDKGVGGAEVARFLLCAGDFLKRAGDPLERACGWGVLAHL